jgi:hypothetical protein
VYVRPDLDSIQTLRTCTGYQELFIQGDSPQSDAELKNAWSSNYIPLYEVSILILGDVFFSPPGATQPTVGVNFTAL